MELFWNPVWFWTLNLLCSLLFLGPKSFTFLLNFCYHFSSFYVPVAFAMTEYTSVPTADCIPLHLSCPHCHFDCMPHRVLPHYCFNDSSSPFLLLPISQLHRAYPNCICPSVIRVFMFSQKWTYPFSFTNTSFETLWTRYLGIELQQVILELILVRVACEPNFEEHLNKVYLKSIIWHKLLLYCLIKQWLRVWYITPVSFLHPGEFLSYPNYTPYNSVILYISWIYSKDFGVL